MALFLVPAALLLLYGASRTLRPGRPRRRLLLILLLLVLVNFNTGPGRELLSVYGDYRSQIAHWKALAQERSRGLEACPFTAEPPLEERKILVVVGESTTRRHMALYGYGHPTTPSLQALQKEGGLYAFDDVISPHCLTMRSLEKVLTTSTNEHPLPFGESISLLDVARKAGFRTTWLSNQDRMGEWDDQVSVLASSADRVQFTSGRTGNNQKAEPDGILLPLLEHLLPTEPGNALVVCHLMGTHREYAHRYPEDYAPQGLGHSDRVEQYDVAIHYGDQFLTQVIRKAQVAGFDTVIYLSDHGEAPEELGYGGHNPNIYKPEMVEIPFLVWLSPRYRQRHPALARRLQRALHRPAMTDNFLHTFLDLAGIRSSLFDPTRSWVNAHFLERPRRVINNTILYP
jgi:heptose-I-phosphate ethanolaminephosphotransferase